jgi:hypothetical protein
VDDLLAAVTDEGVRAEVRFGHHPPMATRTTNRDAATAHTLVHLSLDPLPPPCALLVPVVGFKSVGKRCWLGLYTPGHRYRSSTHLLFLPPFLSNSGESPIP